MCTFVYRRPTNETRVILCRRHHTYAGNIVYLCGKVPEKIECLPVITALEILAGEPVTPWYPNKRRSHRI